MFQSGTFELQSAGGQPVNDNFSVIGYQFFSETQKSIFVEQDILGILYFHSAESKTIFFLLPKILLTFYNIRRLCMISDIVAKRAKKHKDFKNGLA